MTTGFVRRDKGKSLAQVQYVGQKTFTALAGGGQAAATQLTGCMIAVLGTVATSGDSASLPPANVGLGLTVINPTSNPAWLYGSSGAGDTINGVANATGVRMAGKSAVFFQPSSQGNWVTEGLGSGYNANLPTLDPQDGLVAASSSAAVTLPAVLNRAATVGTSGYGFRMPASAPGIQVTFANGASSNPATIWANSSNDVFNTLGGNIPGLTGQIVASGKTVIYTAFSAGVWHANPSS